MAARFGIKLYKEHFHFASAHFLIFGDGRREELHGHNYRVRVEFDGQPGADGLVQDFSALKPLVKATCDELDHRVLLPTKAAQLRIESHAGEVEVRVSDGSRFVFPERDVRLLAISNTSTERLAELLAARLSERIAAALPTAHFDRLRVEVEESPGQCGWYEHAGEACAERRG